MRSYSTDKTYLESQYVQIYFLPCHFIHRFCVTDVINFTLFQSALLYMHYMREKVPPTVRMTLAHTESSNSEKGDFTRCVCNCKYSVKQRKTLNSTSAKPLNQKDA
jgi:hypothetical protein